MKEITIDLLNKDDLYEKYNKNIVSKELINYIVESVYSIKKNDKIKIVINNKTGEKCVPMIIEGLKKEYDKCIYNYNKNNLKEVFYLFIGIIVLFLSTLIEKSIFYEIVLISGWVPIWTVVEIELFSDVENKKKRIILWKLLNSEIIEK